MTHKLLQLGQDVQNRRRAVGGSTTIQYLLTFCLYMHSLHKAPLHSPSSTSVRQLDVMSTSWNELLRHWRSGFSFISLCASGLRLHSIYMGRAREMVGRFGLGEKWIHVRVWSIQANRHSYRCSWHPKSLRETKMELRNEFVYIRLVSINN